MDRETILRLNQMLTRNQRELFRATDANTIKRLNKLIEDVMRQLANKEIQLLQSEQ